MDDRPTRDILDATYLALCEHGFADLTVQDIAAHTETSKATIHYHYDSKRDLFVAFLADLYEGYTDHMDGVTRESPREELFALVEASLEEGDDVPGVDFRTAMLEIKAQSPYDDAFRERLREFDDYLFERIRSVVAAGIEAGEFDDDVDPDRVAEFLTTTISGAHTRRVAVDHSLDRLRETLIEYVERNLVADETAEVSA
ncbi:TetR/AcrR family transcriptional regulator [Halorussus marinus]|uniref:TetR/AcrR family transcriptional regulator n=1 Tax=Halorussus marinus TaxID=2505976 RepID=UPI00106E6CF0|nr:TetR/AcrR family transcriptional regulator [Halorussus marinus]